MRCPDWWPVPDREEIGDERAVELVAYLRTVAPSAVQAARDHLAAKYPDREASAYALPASQIARLYFAPHMLGVCIGSVSCRTPEDGHDVVSIDLERSGKMAIMFHDDDRQPVRVTIG